MKRRKTPRASAVSEQLRSIISARGLSPYSVSRLADVAPSVLTRFVNGERGLTLDTFDRIALALGLRLAEGSRRGKPSGRSDLMIEGGA
jgi:plasmid maintenance system antidote protein VapI